MKRIKLLFTTLLATIVVIAALPASALTGTWSTAVNVSALGERAEDVQLAVDSNGLMTAVWHTYASTSEDEDDGVYIYASTSLNGGPWSEPALISNLDQDSKDPKLVVDSNGMVTVVWESYGGQNVDLQASRSLNGGEWSAVEDITDPDNIGFDAGEPAITVDSNGLVTVVWESFDYDQGKFSIFSSTSLNGAPWSVPEQLSEIGEDATDPQVISDTNGLVTALWTYQTIDGFIHQSRTSLGGAAWSTTQDLGEPASYYFDEKLTVDQSGLVTAVWVRGGVEAELVQSSTSLNGGQWSEIKNVFDSSLGNPDDIAVTTDSSGLVTLAAQLDDMNYFVSSVTVSRSLSGGEWSEAEIISAESSWATDPQLTVDPAGLVTVVWEADESAEVTDDTVQSRTSLNGGVWSSTVHLSVTGGDVDSLDADDPQVIVDHNGRVTAAWERDESRDNNWDIIQSSSVLNVAAPAPPTLAKTGVDFQLLLVSGLTAAVVGSGLVAVSRRKIS